MAEKLHYSGYVFFCNVASFIPHMNHQRKYFVWMTINNISDFPSGLYFLIKDPKSI